MNVAILTTWSIHETAIGGTERFVMDLAQSLNELGNNVDVYMLSGKNYTKDGVKYLNINIFDSEEIIDEYVLRNKFNNFNDEESYENLAKNIERLVNFDKYDLIQINSQLFLKVCENKKRIFTIHTNPFEYKLDWGELSFNVMLEIMKKQSKLKYTKFVTPSKYYAEDYNKLCGIKINFIPHAIEIERIKSNKSREEILNEVGIDNTKKIILLPSRLEPIQKQPIIFIKAFSKFDDNIKNMYKIICTGVDKQYIQYKYDIENFCSKFNIDVLMTRFDNMSDAYKVADIVVLPSRSESFGYAALESLSLGIPTIMNNIPTFKEVAEGSKNNYFFDNSEEALYNLLKKILFDNNYKIVQPKIWQDQYSIINFGKNYLYLFN